jgi:ATP-dependent DNA helicase Rep
MTSDLNAEQRAAVRHVDGPLLVVAGAGSGKTRVIAAKIAHLLQSGHDPGSVFAITFTNKAAREMRERVDALAAVPSGAAGKGPVISTFHSLGLRIVREEARALGLKRGFSVLDTQDAEQILADALGTTDRARVRAVQWAIGRWKGRLVEPDSALAAAVDEGELAAARLYRTYDDTLRAYRAVDFDDLLRLPCRLLSTDREARARWRARVRYLLVDEYQDTNPAQYALLRLLCGEAGAFTAVGDDDQAIYGWRGASAENLGQLALDYPGLRVIKLEQNYRSTIRILRCANTLIGNNPKLYEKRLWSDLGLGDPLRVAVVADEVAEAETVVTRLLAHKFQHRGRFGDYAILYRGNHQARPFEEQLRAHDVPYRLSGGQSFFERSEIKDVLAWIRVIVNEDDDAAFIRAVTTPKRGVGPQTLARLAEVAGRNGESLFAAVFDSGLPAVLPERQREPLSAFAALVNALRWRAERESAGRVLEDLLAGTGYEAHLYDTGDARQAEQRWKNVCDFRQWLAAKGEAESKTLTELAQAIALASILESGEDERHDVVRLSTLHAAKGLEFPQVFLVGVEEGILPHREAVAAGQIEEERRLMYVGITRAQKGLTITWCRRRRRAGESVDCEPSRFIAELPRDDLRVSGEHEGSPGEEKANGLERLRQMRAMLAR